MNNGLNQATESQLNGAEGFTPTVNVAGNTKEGSNASTGLTRRIDFSSQPEDKKAKSKKRKTNVQRAEHHSLNRGAIESDDAYEAGFGMKKPVKKGSKSKAKKGGSTSASSGSGRRR